MKNKNTERSALNNNGGGRDLRVTKNSEVYMAPEQRIILRIIFGFTLGASKGLSGREVQP